MSYACMLEFHVMLTLLWALAQTLSLYDEVIKAGRQTDRQA